MLQRQLEKFYLSSFIHNKAIWLIDYEAEKQFGEKLALNRAEEIQEIWIGRWKNKVNGKEVYQALQKELGVYEK